MLSEIYSGTALPPKTCQLWVLGKPLIWLFIKVSLQRYYIYSFIYLSLLELNCTICKDFSDSIQFLFLIIKFVVDDYHFHINSIAYSVVMRDFPGIFSDIINVYLALLFSGCNSPVKDWRKFKYHISIKDILAWRGHYITVIRRYYFPWYICQVFTPWVYIWRIFYKDIWQQACLILLGVLAPLER